MESDRGFVTGVVGTGTPIVGTHPRLKIEETGDQSNSAAASAIPVLGAIHDAHVAMDPVLQFFRYAHLPDHLQPISAIYAEAAIRTVERVPRNAERTVALRDLLRAKDGAVRAALYQDPGK